MWGGGAGAWKGEIQIGSSPAGVEEDDSSPHLPPLPQLHSILTSCPTLAPSSKRAASPEKASQTKPDQPAAGPSKGKGPATMPPTPPTITPRG